MQILKTQNPVKGLTSILKKHSGRDSSGQVSVRHQGGRQKRYYRHIDFKRDKRDMKATIVQLEYDPNRTANIALVEYADGEKRYILHVEGLKKGDTIVSSSKADIKIGNATELQNVPLGTQIHNVELYPTRGGQMIKTAGGYAIVVAKDGDYADVKLPSHEVRKIPLKCWVTIGQISNSAHKLEKVGKAGTSRLMGRRPTVRGVAQNPRSHPHGGGEGKSGIGMNPKTPWGKIAMGGKTRHPKKWSNKLIVKSRKQK